MQTLSFIWGILAMIGLYVFFSPLLGAFNWLNIPFSAFGFFVGIIAILAAPSKGMRKVAAIFGTLLSGIAMLVGTARLMIGFGMF